MKKSKTRSTKPSVPRRIHVEFHHPTASTVAIAGSFNGWHPQATPMVAMGHGRWLKDLILAPGLYEYLFVVDGQWMVDPGAKGSVANPFGGVNCTFEL